MKKLYDFQMAVLTRLLQFTGVLYAAAGSGVLLVAPTGAGKTVIAGHLIRVLVRFGLRILFVAERKELLDQAASTFRGLGLSVAELRSGRDKLDPEAPVVVASKGVLVNLHRTKGATLPDAGVVVVDEAHRAFSRDWEELLLEGYASAFRLGLSATPERLDGKPLSGLFGRLVNLDVSTMELIKAGRLAAVRYMTPVDPQEWTFSMQGQDFSRSSVARGMRRMRHEIVGAWMRHAHERTRTVAFCVTADQADELAEEFRERGVPAVSVHAKNTDLERDDALRAFERGEVKVLCSVDLFVEGLDLPEVDTVLLARPTMSLRVFLQSIGRGMRAKSNGGNLLVLDCAGNVYRHGLPTWDRREHWALEGRLVEVNQAARRGAYRDHFVSCGACGTLRERSERECSCGMTRDEVRTNGTLKVPRVRAKTDPSLGVDPEKDFTIACEVMGHFMGLGHSDPRAAAVVVVRDLGAKLPDNQVARLTPAAPTPVTNGLLRRNRRKIARILSRSFPPLGARAV